MTAWDFLANHFPPVALTVTGIGAAVVFMIGFARSGMDFIKHGFKQAKLDDSLEGRFDDLAGQMKDVKIELNNITHNHFVYLRKYLGVLNGILLNKEIIDNKDKALLDNELMGM